MGGEGGGGVGIGGTNGAHLKESQLTFFDKNALHCPADRCAGLPGRQFRRS